MVSFLLVQTTWYVYSMSDLGIIVLLITMIASLLCALRSVFYKSYFLLSLCLFSISFPFGLSRMGVSELLQRKGFGLLSSMKLMESGCSPVKFVDKGSRFEIGECRTLRRVGDTEVTLIVLDTSDQFGLPYIARGPGWKKAATVLTSKYARDDVFNQVARRIDGHFYALPLAD